MGGRPLALVVAFSLATLATWTGWVYTHPPLVSFGMAERYDDQGQTLVYAIDLENRGGRPLTLTGVRVGGEKMDSPRAMAVANFTDGLLASSAAIWMEEHGHKLQTGPVRGWKILPDEARPGSYALVLDWQGMHSPPGEIIVYYRYLGLPMRYTFPWTLE